MSAKIQVIRVQMRVVDVIHIVGIILLGALIHDLSIPRLVGIVILFAIVQACAYNTGVLEGVKLGRKHATESVRATLDAIAKRRKKQ